MTDLEQFIPEGYRGRSFDVWNFGDDIPFSERLIALVLSGAKRATVGIAQQQRIPQPGDLGIILDHSKEPRCIVEYTNVVVKPFGDIGLDIVKAEGEGIETIEEWRQQHRAFFKEVVLEDTTPMVCIEFVLLHPRHSIERHAATL